MSWALHIPLSFICLRYGKITPLSTPVLNRQRPFKVFCPFKIFEDNCGIIEAMKEKDWRPNFLSLSPPWKCMCITFLRLSWYLPSWYSLFSRSFPCHDQCFTSFTVFAFDVDTCLNLNTHLTSDTISLRYQPSTCDVGIKQLSPVV